MSNLELLLKKREKSYFSLICLKREILEYIVSPVETISIEQLRGQYEFDLREINNIDNAVKTILLTQIEWAKRDLANLQTQYELTLKDFAKSSLINDLPPYSSIFK